MNELRTSFKRKSSGGRGKTKGPRGVAWDGTKIEHLEPMIVRYDNIPVKGDLRKVTVLQQETDREWEGFKLCQEIKQKLIVCCGALIPYTINSTLDSGRRVLKSVHIFKCDIHLKVKKLIINQEGSDNATHILYMCSSTNLKF